MGEKIKDGLETTASVVVAVAAATGAAAVALPGLVGLAYTRFHDRRTGLWWDRVAARNRAPEDLAEQIEKGLSEDDEHVIAGVVGGARAAASAIELAAVVVIAELSRRFLHERDLPRWFYRAALEVLERLDAEELGALRRLMTEIEPIKSEHITIIADIEFDPEDRWCAFQTSVRKPSVQLTPFRDARRLFGCLRRAGFEAGVGASQAVFIMERRTATWLHDAMCATIEDESGR